MLYLFYVFLFVQVTQGLLQKRNANSDLGIAELTGLHEFHYLLYQEATHWFPNENGQNIYPWGVTTTSGSDPKIAFFNTETINNLYSGSTLEDYSKIFDTLADQLNSRSDDFPEKQKKGDLYYNYKKNVENAYKNFNYAYQTRFTKQEKSKNDQKALKNAGKTIKPSMLNAFNRHNDMKNTILKLTMAVKDYNCRNFE